MSGVGLKFCTSNKLPMQLVHRPHRDKLGCRLHFLEGQIQARLAGTR